MSNSLGTLTLDLVAKIGNFIEPIKKSENQIKESFDKMRNSVNSLSPAMLAGAAAVAGGLAAITMETINAATEIQKVAGVSIATTQQLQYLAVGAKELGVEQEKLGDIFKDVNEKIGEFVATEGGGLTDFFENIAPKVGVTADQFAKLAGADALQLYVDSLEKAGLSQQEMTYYMETLASDATVLLPLLKGNGAGFKAFGDEALRAGAILSDDVIQGTNQLRAGQFLLEQQLKGLKNEIVVNTLPTVINLAEAFSSTSEDGVKLVSVGGVISGTLKGVASTALGATAAVDILGKSLANAAVGAKSAWDGFDFKGLLFKPGGLMKNFMAAGANAKAGMDAGGGAEDISKTIEGYANKINKIWDGVETKSKLDELATFYQKINQYSLGDGQNGNLGAKAAAEVAKAQKKQADVASKAAEIQQRERLKEFEQISDSQRSQTQIIADEHNKRTAIITEFASSNRAKFDAMMAYEKSVYQERLTQEQIAHEQQLRQFSDFYASETEIVKRNLAEQIRLISKRTDFDKSEKEVSIQLAKDRAVTEIRLINNRNAQELLTAKQSYLSQADFMTERYRLEREEIQKTIGKSKELKDALIAASKLKEFEERQAIKNAASSLYVGQQTNQFQRKDPFGYAGWDLQNQYESNSTGMADAYSNQKGAIATDPLLDEQSKNAQLLDAEKEYLAAKATMNEEYAQKQKTLDRELMDFKLGNAQDIFSSLTDIAKTGAGEQSKVYKAMFTAQKAFSVARSMMAISTGIAEASANPFPYNLAAMASVAAATASIVSDIQSVHMEGFANGGYTGAGGKYETAGLVHKGEVVWSQEDIKRSGGVSNVEAMRKGSSSNQPIVNVNVIQGQGVKVTTTDDGQGNITVEAVRQEIANMLPNLMAGELANQNSRTSKSLKQNFNVAPKR